MTAMWLASWGIILLSIVRLSVGDSNEDNLFIFPTAPGPSNQFVANLRFPLGSTQNIQWTTLLGFYSIALFQQNIDPPSGRQLDTIYRM